MRVSLPVLSVLFFVSTQTSFAAPGKPISGPNAKPLSIQFDSTFMDQIKPRNQNSAPKAAYVVFQNGVAAYKGNKPYSFQEEKYFYTYDSNTKKWTSVDPTKPHCILKLDMNGHMFVDRSKGDVLDDSEWKFKKVDEDTKYQYAPNVRNGMVPYFTPTGRVEIATMVLATQEASISLEAKKDPPGINSNSLFCRKGYKSGYPNLDKFESIPKVDEREAKIKKEVRSHMGIKEFEQKDLENVFKTPATRDQAEKIIATIREVQAAATGTGGSENPTGGIR